MNGYCSVLHVEYVGRQMSENLLFRSLCIVYMSLLADSQKWLFTGNPVPEITWHKDGQLLQEDEAHHIMSGGRFLQITNAQVSHTGRYTCLASSSAGDKSRSFSLNVFGRRGLFFIS